MGRTRRGFTPEYKDEAVKLVINTGRTLAAVARELGLKEQTLGRWVRDFRARAMTANTHPVRQMRKLAGNGSNPSTETFQFSALGAGRAGVNKVGDDDDAALNAMPGYGRGTPPDGLSRVIGRQSGVRGSGLHRW